MLTHFVLIVFACSYVKCSFSSFGSNYYSVKQQQSQTQSIAGSGKGRVPSSSPYQEPNNAIPPDSEAIIQSLGLPPNIPQNLVPVPLISSEAQPMTSSPLKISLNRKAQLSSKNDGYLVSSVPAGQNEVATLTGGPANNFEYIFGLLGQNQDGVANHTRASTTEDGVGYPAQCQVFFYKKNYKSFKNALKYKDGLMIIPFNILVEGSVPNPLFEAYGSLLKRLIQPNSTSSIGAYDALNWLLSTLEPGYYTHASSYIDLPTGREYPCATNISPNFATHPFVSYEQYVDFTSLLNRNFQPEYNPLPLYPLAGREVYQMNSPVYYNYYN